MQDTITTQGNLPGLGSLTKIWQQGFHTVESEVEVCVGATVPHPLFEDDLGCKCKLPHEADSFLRIIIKEITN